MDKYLNTTIINARSTLRRNNKDVFSIIRDTFQEESISSFKTFKRKHIKNDKDLLIAYHEKRIMDSIEEYISMLKDVFKDSEIRKLVVDEFYD